MDNPEIRTIRRKKQNED